MLMLKEPLSNPLTYQLQLSKWLPCCEVTSDLSTHTLPTAAPALLCASLYFTPRWT